jgi:septum formation protein
MHRRLILASASPRRRELLTQAGYLFEVEPAHVNEDLQPDEDATAYVLRLAREKALFVYAAMSSKSPAPPQVAGAPGLGSPATGLRRGGGDLDSETWDSTNSDAPSIAVLGADTTVTIDNHILAKPEDSADAARMLRLLSGRTHRVITGVAIATERGVEVAAEVTGVQFKTLSDAEIAAYVATGEPMDKAGAYGIQGLAAKWIPRVEGCYFNVVGLPLALVTTMLERLEI